MTAPTLNGESLGKVTSITVEKTEDLFIVAPPEAASSATILEELTGVTKIINIKGTMTGTSVANLKTNLDAIGDIIDGSQGATVEFVSDVTGTINVAIQSFQFTYTTETRVTAEYTLALVEGTWGT